MQVILGFFIGIVSIIALIIVCLYIFRNKVLFFLEQKLKGIFPDVLSHANEQLIAMADQKLGAKKDAIEELIKQVKEGLKDTDQKLETAEKDRVGSYSALKQELEGHRKITEQLSVTTEGLKNVLSNNQLRGKFGEQIAEDLLRMSGFVNEVDYLRNKKQQDGRPDFSVLLPDGIKINVDVKFPYANLQRMSETKDEGARLELLKAFKIDVKAKIKQISTREYINPADNTVDFAIMFIPNEMIFSFIYENMHDIWSEGMKQKVIFAGPFSFTAILRLIRQSYSNFKYQKNIYKIINLINSFEEEFKKYNEEFQKIGIKIGDLSVQYDKVNSTRTRQLVRTVEKIKSEETPKLIPDSTILPSDEVVIESELKN